MSYGTAYIDIPQSKPLKGGKSNKMQKSTNNVDFSKPAKRYAKTRGEHYKDIVIAMLIVGILAFVGGMHFANQHTAEISKAASATSVKTPVKK